MEVRPVIKQRLTPVILAGAVIAGVAMAAVVPAQAREQIRIVGSSTVFPFSTAVAENFGKTTSFKTPVVESTGTGGGMKLFCAGIGDDTPDITNASRRIKKSEFETCIKSGVGITEVRIGFDGIVLANAKSAPRFTLSKQEIFLALAKDVPGPDGKLIANPYKTWNEINPALPAERIEVLGPPPTSGTRDAFVELAMEGGAKTFDSLKALDKKAFKAVAHTLREDGAYIEAGENDNLIVQKLESNPKAVGIFGFSFLDQNADKLQGAIVDGKEPTFENIADGGYAVSRSLYFYVKQQHIDQVPGIKEYVAEFTSDRAWGDDGYLVDKGLIPLPVADRKAMRDSATGMAPLAM
jgi:phosphate transport system substrate-binding protein